MNTAVFSSNGKQVVTASNDDSAKIWNTATGKQLHVLTGHTDNVNMASFSRDGKQVVTASNDNTVKIWDAENGKLMRDVSMNLRFTDVDFIA